MVQSTHDMAVGDDEVVKRYRSGDFGGAVERQAQRVLQLL
jgi:hypothetical protein